LPNPTLAETLAAVGPLDVPAMAAARELHSRLTKPAGSLGELEELSVRLAGLSGTCPPPIPEPAAVAVFAGDHGVYAQGVTPWPQEVTGQMVLNFLAGGAVVNAFARQTGASVTVIDIAVASPLPAVEAGIRTAERLVDEGARILVAGDMGIANTTPAAALIAAFTGASPEQVTGRGTGIDDEMLAHKTSVVARALALHRPDPADPLGVLAAVGGGEHAAIAGFMLGAAARRVPVVVDGVIAVSGALAAVAFAPDVLGALVSGHRSAEPGASVALAYLGLNPLVDLGLRLGEGTGAVLALPIVASAVRVLHEVATFDSAGVSEK